MAEDTYAPLRERAWWEVAAIDAQLERGEIDEDGWHQAMMRYRCLWIDA